MQNKTIIAALKLGFDLDEFDPDITLDELTQSVLDFLNENLDKLKVTTDFCEVTGNGGRQHVSHGDFESSGEIISYAEYYGKRKQRIFHSSYLYINTDGTPLQMKLYCYSK